MAEAHFDDFEPRQGLFRSAATGRAINVIAALSSASLAIGAGVWAWQIAMRDISGVPVIRAIEGPMRIAPEDPGGQIAAYTGLSVNAVVADLPDDGAGQRAPSGLLRAPAPVTLDPDDAAGLGLVATQAPEIPMVSDAPSVVLDAVAEAMPGANGAADLPRAAGSSAALGQADAAVVFRTLPAPPRPAGLGRPHASTLRATGAAPASGGGDPVAAALASALAAVAPLAAAPVREVSTADLPAGTRLAQLGTYADAASARAGWDALAARSGALMAGKARLIEAAEISGQTRYRLRAQGFDSEDAARRFCAAIEANGQVCVPVTHR